MAKACWIARFDMSDLGQRRNCVAANAATQAQHGARFLVRDGACESTEGCNRERNIVVEFPSHATEFACYRSSDHQAALDFRRHVAVGDLLVIEGCGGPQPEGAQA